MFHRSNFWIIQESQRLSSTVRSMLQLRPMLKDYMRCLIRDGTTASFWFDTWTELGQLISVIGDNGLHDLRIHKEATVAEAASNGSWILSPARSPITEIVQIVVTTIPPPSPISGHD